MHWGITSLLKFVNCPRPSPFFRQSPPSILFFVTLPLKVGFSRELQKYQSFSSLTASYLLKVPKFLVKISKFKFLVMTEKNIFVYKLFLSLNISDFILPYNLKIDPPPNLPPPLPEKSHPL